MLVLLALFGLAAGATLAASAAEVAVFALPDPRIKELESTGSYAGRVLATLRARPVGLLATVWTLRIAATALAALAAWGAAALAFGESMAVPVAAAALTVLVLMLGELVAKMLALRCAERLCLLVAVPLWILSRAFFVPVWLTQWLARVLSADIAAVLPRITDREIRDLVNPGNGEPVIDEHERRLIQRAFLLDQTTAYDAMTPRVDIFAWSETRTLAQIAPELRATRYSRVPLYAGSIDKITGVLYIREAYQALISGQRDLDLRSLAREPFFLPGSVTLDKLLLDFQTRRIHMGIVIDEYGGTDGLITLEDILEELVGEIVDETDVPEEPIIRLNRNEILVDGSADLREINHFFNTTFPLLEHRSLNGYLLDVLGQVPQPGEKVVREGVLIEVTEASDTQVVRARLTRQAPPASREEGDSTPDSAEGSERVKSRAR